MFKPPGLWDSVSAAQADECTPQKEMPYPLAVIPLPLFPQPLATTHLHSVSMDLPILDVSYQWVSGFFHVVCFRGFTHIVAFLLMAE